MTRKATAPVAIETVPIHRGQWIDLVLRMDIPSQRKSVAFALSRFANPDGTNVFPGQPKVADMAKLHETNARKHIRALIAAGMLIVVKRGGGRGGATNTYRLSRPADITTLPLWLDPDMNRVESKPDDPEKYRALAPGEDAADEPEQGASALGVSVDNLPDGPVDNSETESAAARYSEPVEQEIPSVSTRNTERSVQKYRALALPDQPNTNPRPTQHHTGSTKAPHSLALVPPVRVEDETTTEPEPTNTPAADAELDAAVAVLAAMRRPAADAWRHAARRKLEADGLPLSRRAETIRAAELAAAAEHATNGVA